MELRIRDLREDADLTQKQVAEILHCDQSLYSRYETGDRAIPLTFVYQCPNSITSASTTSWG